MEKRKVDFLEIILIIFAMFSLGFIEYTLIYVIIPVENRELLIHTVGIVEGIVLTIYTYKFGSSEGSKSKTEMLNSVQKKPPKEE